MSSWRFKLGFNRNRWNANKLFTKSTFNKKYSVRKKHKPSTNATSITTTAFSQEPENRQCVVTPDSSKISKLDKQWNIKKKNAGQLLKFPASEKLFAFNLRPWPLSKISVTNITSREKPKWLCYSLGDRIETLFQVGPETCLVPTAFRPLLGQASLLRTYTEARPHGVAAETLRSSLAFIQCLGYECVEYTSTPQ